MHRRTVLLAVILVFVAACGGGTEPASSQPTTSAGAGSSAPSTQAPEVTPPSTEPASVGDTHPAIPDGPTWDEVWPEAGATATYLAFSFASDPEEIEARIEYGVEFRGQMLDRLVFASDTPGERGLVVYFDRSTPWVFKLVAAEVYSTNENGGPSYTELFDGPMPFDGRHGAGESSEFGGLLISENADGSTDEFDIGYRVTTTTIDGEIDVPFGLVDGVMHIAVRVGFPDVGDWDPAAELWLHPELFLVRMTGTPSWNDLQLVTPFS